MNDRLTYFGWGATAVVSLAAGIGIGFLIWGQRGTADAPAPAVRQKDNSLELQRQPITVIGPAVHELPQGTEVRRVSVTVKPTNCAPTHLDLSLVRDDGGMRVVASSPDGQVTGGADQPIVRPLEIESARLWAAGTSFAGRNAFGAFLQRDVLRLRFGLELNANRDGGIEARATVGWTW